MTFQNIRRTLVNNLNLKVSALLMLVCSLFTQSLLAEQSVSADGYKVHYNAFTSSMLTADVAKRYGIVRSKSLGVLNIATLKESGDAVTAFIEGSVKDPLSKSQNLKFTKVTEGDAIYYIATFRFTNADLMRFNLYVAPTGEKRSIKVAFDQKFYLDN
jgi:hypothetical protein